MSEQKWSERLEELYLEAITSLGSKGTTATCIWLATKAWADELQAAGNLVCPRCLPPEPLTWDNPREVTTDAAGNPLPYYVKVQRDPQDNPGDRTEGQDEETAADVRYCELRPSEMRRRLYEQDARISELEAQRASFEKLFLDATRVAEAAGAERDSLREQVRLWEATRKDVAQLASFSIATGSAMAPEARSILASLPPPVAPEPAELPATPSTLTVIGNAEQRIINEISDRFEHLSPGARVKCWYACDAMTHDETVEAQRARISELEAQLAERDTALTVAEQGIRAIAVAFEQEPEFANLGKVDIDQLVAMAVSRIRAERDAAIEQVRLYKLA